MSDKGTPEAGERCKVKTGAGEEIAIWTGHMWASEDGSRIIEGSDIQSWKEAPCETPLEIIRPAEGGD